MIYGGSGGESKENKSVFCPLYKDKKTGEPRRSGKCCLSFNDHKGIRRAVVAPYLDS